MAVFLRKFYKISTSHILTSIPFRSFTGYFLKPYYMDPDHQYKYLYDGLNLFGKARNEYYFNRQMRERLDTAERPVDSSFLPYNEVKIRVLAVLRSMTKIRSNPQLHSKCNEEAHLFEDLSFDSLDAIDFITEVEMEFQCQLTDKEAEQCVRVNDIINIICNTQFMGVVYNIPMGGENMQPTLTSTFVDEPSVGKKYSDYKINEHPSSIRSMYKYNTQEIDDPYSPQGFNLDPQFKYTGYVDTIR